MTTPDQPQFGLLLRRLRTAAAISQEVLAERAGLSLRAISDLERGVHRAPRLETVRLLADALQLSVHQRSDLLAAARPEEPPLSAATAERRWPRPSLPLPPTRLIGREREVAALTDLLMRDDHRLVTLTGAGGSGKTRLAQEVAAQTAVNPPDGVWFVDLSPLTDATLVVPTIAAVLGERESVMESSREALSRYLRGRHLILLLDNCEHVLEAAPDIADLLASTSKLVILATSREPLRLRGEQEFPILPLPLPEMHPISLIGGLVVRHA